MKILILVFCVQIVTCALEKMQEQLSPSQHSGFGNEFINYNPDIRLFQLNTRASSFAFFIDDLNRLQHLYWGPRIPLDENVRYLTDYINEAVFDAGGKNSRLWEYPDYGTGDFRNPAFKATFMDDGTSISPLQYLSHLSMSGLPSSISDEIPHFRADSNQSPVFTLLVNLHDPLKNLLVTLRYSVFPEHDTITRSVTFTNNGNSDIILSEVSSVSIDFPAAPHDKPYHLTHLAGSWAHERRIHSQLIQPTTTIIESTRGATSPQHNPFIMISEGAVNEESGHHYAIGLVYGSSFEIAVERDQTSSIRVRGAIHHATFNWKLQPGEEFITPEAVTTYGYGVKQLSHNLHNAIREHLLPGSYRTHWTPSVPRPILVNSWEAMYFDCTEDRIMSELVIPASRLGIEMVVVDDGWFINRWNDYRALGDWYVDPKKFPHGLGGLEKKMAQYNIKLGIWMEPEMISKESNLFKDHSDWALHTPGRDMTEGRHQLVLDLSKTDVQNFIIEAVRRVLLESNASYLKWDFNRHLTEVSSTSVDLSRQGEVFHRWVLGLYRIWNEITLAFPHVLFESCSSGGGRFDLSLLYFTPQIWTSDNTDALSRVQIQTGTSLFYPFVSMASHVSVIPNHQVHRSTGFGARHMVAMSGTFGYELNLSKLNDQEKDTIKQMVQFYKNNIRDLVYQDQISPKIETWMFGSKDGKKAVMFAVLTSFYEVILQPGRRQFKGLNPREKYMVHVYHEDENSKKILVLKKMELYGQTLMSAGVNFPIRSDIDAVMITAHQI